MLEASTNTGKDGPQAVTTSPEPSAGHFAALRDAEYLRQPVVRSIWQRLSAEQQAWVFDPSSHPDVKHRYPLSTGDLAALTGLSDSQIRWWADHNQLAHERTEGNHRQFGISALVTALALSGSRQHEVQFFRELVDAPDIDLSRKVSTFLFVLSGRLGALLSDSDQKRLSNSILAIEEIAAGEGNPDPSRKSMPRNKRHVVPNPDGGWDVKAPGANRASAHTRTQGEAIGRAREIVGTAGGGEIVIHGRDGRIRDSDIVVAESDPSPQRDKR